MDKYEYCGSYQLTCKAKQEQKDNKFALKVAEMNYFLAKKTLTNSIKYHCKNHFYICLYQMPEYLYYLGCKEVLKRVNTKRKNIKNYIKNINK